MPNMVPKTLVTSAQNARRFIDVLCTCFVGAGLRPACAHYMVKNVLIGKNRRRHRARWRKRRRFVELEFILYEMPRVMVNHGFHATRSLHGGYAS